MTVTASPQRAKLLDRWPTALGLLCAAGAITVIALLDRDAQLFGPSVAVMAAIYLMAYAVGRPWSAWLAFVVSSAVVSVLHVLYLREILGMAPALAMTLVLVPLWLWAVARRRFADGRTFLVQTAGMIGFGVITVLCAVVQPQLAIALAGVGFLAHGAWDVHHFRVDKVVNRPWSEFCGVVDFPVGIALIVAAMV